MFAVVVSGRLVQTEYQQVTESQFIFSIPNAEQINHVVVFMTGVQAFASALGGAVYFSWPDALAERTWQFLGCISNNKPSAIFKITGLKRGTSSSQHPFAQQAVAHEAQIGISVEPLANIEAMLTSAAATSTSADSMLEFPVKMLENFFNYAASFTQPQTMLNASESYVPLSTMQNWYSQLIVGL